MSIEFKGAIEELETQRDILAQRAVQLAAKLALVTEERDALRHELHEKDRRDQADPA